ncbi:TM0106 family RecB-like putative nuclease [Janibacter melonis]|uniref:TM0106 family RecB-like putative nuclease n=1 Tax=Janibacter melonis TaxID=262209 RepID=UPI002044B869|nr:TM0106 family RecB-like putative nuclease [Janibacter melonis]MCM3553899.1 TM0106 family RecB-like putative nuclease [Janibacter melonis]
MLLIDRDATGTDAPQHVVLSASDLRAATACEHALLAELDVRAGRSPEVPHEVDPVVERAAELGTAHEQRHLAALSRAHPGAVRGATAPERTPAGYAAGMQQTLQLMADPAVRVIHQACVYDGDFLGFVDFLIREDDGSWVVVDAKLARSESVTALLQTGAYAEVLGEAVAALDGVRLAPFVRLVLGDDEVSDTRLADLLPVVRARRERLADVVGAHLRDDGPVRWGDERWEACLRCEHCTAELEARDDVLLVAGVHVEQHGQLLAAGVRTVADLADLPEGAVVPGMRPDRLDALREQARLQRAAAEGGDLPFAVHHPQGLAALRTESDGDVFFDFEGDPMWHVPGSGDWGLEYLFGCLWVEDGVERYRGFWAHDRVSERQALLDFLDWLQERRRTWPELHVYHYADYERAALLRLSARHAVGQEVVDGLLADGVLVDLYPVVRAAVRVGSSSYSIKRLEPLYMERGEDRDREGVTGGADSIVEYHRYAQAVLDGDTSLAASRLEDIRQYNEYDCLSTLRLRDWLLRQAREHHVEPQPGRAKPDPDTAVQPVNPLEVALRELAGDTPPEQRTPEQQAVAMLSAAVQYHRREDKPYWWGHFDRLESPPEQWARGTDVVLVREAETVTGWAQGTSGNPRRTVRVLGEGSGMRAGVGSKVLAVYGPDRPECLSKEDLPHGCRDMTVLAQDERVDPETGEVLLELVLVEVLPKDADPYDDLPIGLGPSAPPGTATIAAAIAEVGQGVLAAGGVSTGAGDDTTTPTLGRSALDLLLRRPPRLRDGSALPAGGTPITDIRDALLAMDDSYLAVQGPPGTGKTYVGSRVVRDLVLEHGWRVGVVAQSHAAVEHLLGCVVAAGVPRDQVGKAAQGGRAAQGEEPSHTTLPKDGHAAFAAAHAAAGRGYVIGGTTWDLTNTKRIERRQLDLVVVDEAGQFALAPTIACSAAGARLLLLGDPQQLGQVSQGSHPEPVDRSALGWLLGDRATIPAEHGYFLATTWRMHPELTEHVSRLAYDDQLGSHEAVTTARSLEGVEPGLHVVEVDHLARRTSSPEEAAAVVDLVRSLAGRAWTDEHGTRALTPGDVIVVTPYNHQVRTLRGILEAAGLAEVEVGTVDKFQGQEAPVAVLSMAASSAHDVSRGLRFVLDRHRLNVAISRGQHAAYVVLSPRLLDATPRTPGELRSLGAFMGLVQAGSRRALAV